MHITGSGPYHRIDTAVRSFIFPRTNELATSGKPFIIHYKGGIKPDTMEVTVATNESLLWLRQLGLERVVSDSRVSFASYFYFRFCYFCLFLLLLLLLFFSVVWWTLLQDVRDLYARCKS